MIDNYKQLLEEALDEVMMNEVKDGNDAETEEEPVVMYTESPYEVIEKNVEKQYYQVIGNEIITITRGRGVCCLCGILTEVLYTDNTYNSNIPVQICKSCIGSILK